MIDLYTLRLRTLHATTRTSALHASRREAHTLAFELQDAGYLARLRLRVLDAVTHRLSAQPWATLVPNRYTRNRLVHAMRWASEGARNQVLAPVQRLRGRAL